MHRYILNAYSYYIKCIGCISKCIEDKKKQTISALMIFTLCVLGIIRHFNTSLKDLMHYTDLTAVITGTIALLVLLIVSIDKYTDYKRININRYCLYGWLLCFITAFIMSFINPVRTGYFAWSIISLFFSIPFVMIWAVRDDFLRFCILLARTMTIAAGCFVIINLVVVPFIRPSAYSVYFGLMSNPNGNGMICTGLYAASFFLLLVDNKGLLLSSIITGFCIAFCYISNCRTAQISIAIESIVGAAYCIKYFINKGETINSKKIIITCAIIIITALTGILVLTELGRMDINTYALDNSGTITTEGETPGLEDTLNHVSSSRFQIWKAFISEATFCGKGSPDTPLIPGYEASIYAHNNAIEIMYTSGVFAFIGYTVFLISGIVFVLRCLSGKNGYKKEYILVMMAFTGYSVEAMLEIVMYPMCHMPAILLNLCMMPIFLSYNKETETD